jgi:septal ring factor EnvC (AmiA/AmiB activator)
VSRRETVPLRDYIDRGLAELARYHDATVSGIQAEIDRRLGEVQRETEGRLREQATAREQVAASLERRLDGMNEFREQVRDTTARKIDADLFRQTVGELMGRLERAEAALERQRGRMSAYVAGTSFLMLAIAILTLVINHYRF